MFHLSGPVKGSAPELVLVLDAGIRLDERVHGAVVAVGGEVQRGGALGRALVDVSAGLDDHLHSLGSG